MKAPGWIAAAVVTGGVVIAAKGCLSSSSSEPDVRLTKRLDQMCQIARENKTTPVKGVKKLGVFLVKHTGDMAKDFVDSFATIEKIRDDAKHDERARLTRKRWVEQGEGCMHDWAEFLDAVDSNDEASELIERANVRLGRTFEIIFGDGQSFDLRTMPFVFSGRMDRVLIRK